MKTALELLREARELISVPERWTQGENARDKYGNPAWHDENTAVQWCMVGALLKVSQSQIDDPLGASEYRNARYALNSVIRGLGLPYGSDYSISSFNDYVRHHSDVIAVYDEAIGSTELRVLSAGTKPEVGEP